MRGKIASHPINTPQSSLWVIRHIHCHWRRRDVDFRPRDKDRPGIGNYNALLGRRSRGIIGDLSEVYWQIQYRIASHLCNMSLEAGSLEGCHVRIMSNFIGIEATEELLFRNNGRGIKIYEAVTVALRRGAVPFITTRPGICNSRGAGNGIPSVCFRNEALSALYYKYKHFISTYVSSSSSVDIETRS